MVKYGNKLDVWCLSALGLAVFTVHRLHLQGVQAWLLIPLTFARHSLSPLAAFTSSAYFLHNGRWWLWIREFYTATLKTFLEAHSQNVSGNKQ